MPNAFKLRSMFGMGLTGSETDSAKPASDRDRGDMGATLSRANRSLQMRENLDALMRQIEHTRRDTDQMMEEMSALEIDAEQASALRRENDVLREKLDDSARETRTEATKAENAARDISRLKEELMRIRADHEQSQREASANALDAERIEDRLHAAMASLDETKRDLEIQRQARDKAETDSASLRINLTERDRAQSTLMQAEAELRLHAAKLQAQYEEVTDALARKERRVIEKTAELDATKDRIAELETEVEASREELRILGNKYSDLRVSQDARIYSLNDGLDQERENHRMTRQLLEEARSSNDDLADEVSSLKNQTLASDKDSQKLKRELSVTRTQLLEDSDKLKEAHLQYATAQSDIQRLEVALEDAKKGAVTLRRQADKSDQILRENTDLHDKIASMQKSLDRHRNKELFNDGPIMLSSAKRPTEPSPRKAKVGAAITTTPNVARIRRS
ncbi:MAG: hypothetical protein AAGI28_00590 [Pseudomonadota bacterium]